MPKKQSGSKRNKQSNFSKNETLDKIDKKEKTKD